MNFMNLIDKALEENMTERSFILWNGIKKIIPDIWEKASSSSKKYHKKENGDVPNIAEHTFEMIYAATKIFRMFDIQKKTSMADSVLFSLVLHDSLKYGKDGNKKHTISSHDQLAANMIKANKNSFMKILNENEYEMLEEAVRFHSGRWSTDVNNSNNFDFKDFNPVTLFCHTLDMMSTADLIKIWKKDLEE